MQPKTTVCKFFSPISNCQCRLFPKKNPTIRIFCISGWLVVPINPDNCSSTVCNAEMSKEEDELQRFVLNVKVTGNNKY